MVRAATLFVALALSAGADAQLDQYGGGGSSKSPDGRWRVWSHVQALDEEPNAIAWLSGPGVSRRRLMRYERGMRVHWMADRRHVVLIDRTAHFSWLAVFDLATANRMPSDRMQTAISRHLAAKRPKLGNIGNRLTAVGRGFSSAPCVLVEESGLPPGRSEGSYLARRAAFRLDLETGRAIPVPVCPGATLE